MDDKYDDIRWKQRLLEEWHASAQLHLNAVIDSRKYLLVTSQKTLNQDCRGMKTHNEKDSLDKLKESCASSNSSLDADDIEQLKLIIEAYRGWQILGMATKWLVLFLAGLSGIFVALGHIKEGFKLWLR